MANVIQIPQLPAATALNGSEQLEAVQAGVSVRITTDQIVALVPAPIPPPPAIWPVGHAIFIGAYANLTSGLLTSAQMYTIRTDYGLYQTFGKSTWTAWLDIIPPTTVTAGPIEVRVDGGMNGVTRGEHPAAGTWTLAAGQDPLGNNNPFCFEIVGSTFVAGCFYTKGHLYVQGTPIDAAAPFNAFTEEVLTVGPGTIWLPAGCLWAQSKPLYFPGNCSLIGHGGYNTTIVLADTSLQPSGKKFHNVLATGVATSINNRDVSEVRIQGMRLLGNRARQRYGVGGSLAAFGGNTDNGVPISMWLDDFGGAGAAGYFMQFGGHNFKQRLRIGRIEMAWSDSDLIDVKNRENLNEVIFANQMDLRWWAMGDQGTNLRPTIALPTNAITTTINSNRVTISTDLLGNKMTPGDVVTISSATSGNGIDPNGSWPVFDTSGGLVTLSVNPQTASGTGGIGGSSAVAFAPEISVGDVPLDLRGIGWVVDTLWAESMIYGRNGPRQRGGTGANADGIGGVNAIFKNMFVTDLSPDPVGMTTGSCRGMVTALGDGLTIGTLNLSAPNGGGGVGIHTAATATNTRIDNLTTVGLSIPVKFEGDKGVIFRGRFIDTTFKNTEVFGGTSNNRVDLITDPCSGTTSSNIVTITCDGPHGETTGAKAGFINLTNGNGIIIRRSNVLPYYPITVLNDTQFTIVADGSIINGAVTWGGPAASVRFNGDPHTATGNEFHHLTFEYSDPDLATGIIGLSIGAQTQADGSVSIGQADGTIVHFVRDEGSQFPRQDFGTNTDYVIGNAGGIPNQPALDILDVPPLSSSSITNNLLFEYGPILSSAAYVSAITITSLDSYEELLIEIEGVQHNSGSGQNWGIEFSTDNGDTWLASTSDYQRIGTTNASKLIFCGSIVAGLSLSGLIQITNFNLSAQRTEVWINGGQDGAATGAQNANGYAVVPQKHNAVRIIPGAGQITGGAVRVYGKQGGDIGN